MGNGSWSVRNFARIACVQVVAAKMELHDALAQAGKLTPIHT